MKLTLVLFIVLLLPVGTTSAVVIPPQKINQTLHAQLPAKIRSVGELVAVHDGFYPPYVVYFESNTVEGASGDLAKALGEVLGLKIKHVIVYGFPTLLQRMKSGYYDIAIGPIGDFTDRYGDIDFIDYVKEYVVFAVKKNNPTNIHSLNDICGKRIGAIAGASAEKVLINQTKICVKEGKEAIHIEVFRDTAMSAFALRANRLDAFFSAQAPLSFYVAQASDELELAAVGQHNGYTDLYQGSIVLKNSPLGPIILRAYQELFDNGTYALIMKKWGLESNMINAPDINMAGHLL